MLRVLIADDSPTLALLLLNIVKNDGGIDVVGIARDGREAVEMTYQFNHVITQEVAYERILKKQRKVLHQIVGETIEHLYKERLEEQYEFLAHHYSMSEDHDQAIKYLELAGDKAARNYSLVEARNYYMKAMGLIDAKEKTEEDKRKRLEISL